MNKISQNSLHAPLLSIIICVYNTSHEYLDECLGSIYRESIDRLEVIVVDDGSEKCYSKIITKYSPKYIKTENRGLLSARITGIEASHGEYIAFVDSDDVVTCTYHEPMLTAAIKSGADITVGEWAYLTKRGISVHECRLHRDSSKLIDRRAVRRSEYGKSKNTRHEGESSCCMALDCGLELLLNTAGTDHTYYVMWNKIYKRELLEKTSKKLRQLSADTKGLTYGEDVLFNYFNFKYSGRIFPFSSGLYLYRIHPHQSVSSNTASKLIEQIRSMGYIFDILLRDANTPDLRRGVEEWRQLTARSQYGKARLEERKYLFALIYSTYNIYPSMARACDCAAYTRREAAGRNFMDIDDKLREICDTRSDINIFYEKSCRYINRILASYKSIRTDVKTEPTKTVSIPKRRITISDRISASHLLLTVAAHILPPGSRLRQLLKRHMTI